MVDNFITCAECSNCYIAYETGFAGATTYHCADRELKQVKLSDGCTFGTPGEHDTLKTDYDVSIETYAAVNGWDEDV